MIFDLKSFERIKKQLVGAGAEVSLIAIVKNDTKEMVYYTILAKWSDGTEWEIISIKYT